MREELENKLNMNSSMDMVEQVTYLMYGAVVTSTKAYKGAEIKIDPNTQMIFVKIKVRWWAKFKKFEKIRRYLLNKTEESVSKFVPQGFRLLVYYEEGL